MTPSRVEVGKISRPHGLRGELVVDLITDQTKARTSLGVRLWAGDRAVVIEASRPHQHRWLMTFEGVFDRAAAEALSGRTLYGEPIVDDDAIWVSDLIGCRVVETSGAARGRVVCVLDNPASALMELDSGALVPMAFVLSCVEGVVTIEPPEGLFDL